MKPIEHKDTPMAGNVPMRKPEQRKVSSKNGAPHRDMIEHQPTPPAGNIPSGMDKAMSDMADRMHPTGGMPNMRHKDTPSAGGVPMKRG